VMATTQLAELSRTQQAIAERKTQLANAALNLQRSRSHDDLIRVYLDESHKLLGVLQGVVYLLDAGSQTTLRLAGSYACAEFPPPALTVGEGLLGQCAVERRTQIINTVPNGFGSIRSGLGETPPATLMLAPILLNAQLIGVVEMAMLTHISDAEREQFEEMTALLAMNLEIIGRSVPMEQNIAATQLAAGEPDA
jgi:two-component system C4-dicarboxylate transport sensor histidine kinase DctB